MSTSVYRLSTSTYRSQPINPRFLVYTDGSGTGWSSEEHEGDAGGWAAVINDLPAHKRWRIAGGETASTSQRMELTAIVHALSFILEKLGVRRERSCGVMIRSDSSYACGLVNQAIEPKSNLDLVSSLFYFRHFMQLQAVLIPRNSMASHAYVDAVSKLARERAKELEVQMREREP